MITLCNNSNCLFLRFFSTYILFYYPTRLLTYSTLTSPLILSIVLYIKHNYIILLL
jgi:hypothetical protein